jgi:hypothetical protein
MLGGQHRDDERGPVRDGVAFLRKEDALNALLDGEDLLNLGTDPFLDGFVAMLALRSEYRLMRFSVVLNR